MHLPPVLSVLLILAGLWSVVAWPLTARRINRAPGAAATAPAAGTASSTGSGDAASGAAAPTPRPAVIPLIVVAISMTLGAATIIVGIRAF